MTKIEIKFNALKTKNAKRLFVLKLCKDPKYIRLMKYKKISLSTVEIAFKVSQGIEIRHNKEFTYDNGIEERKF